MEPGPQGLGGDAFPREQVVQLLAFQRFVDLGGDHEIQPLTLPLNPLIHQLGKQVPYGLRQAALELPGLVQGQVGEDQGDAGQVFRDILAAFPDRTAGDGLPAGQGILGFAP